MNRLGKVALRLAAASAWVIPTAGLTAPPSPPPLEAYGELPAIEDMAISPSGKLAMLTSSGGQRVLAILDEALRPVNAIRIGDLKVRGFEWIGDEAIMVERSDTRDTSDRFIARNMEFFNAMIVPAESGGEVRTIFADDKSIVNAVFGSHGFRKVDGKWIGLFVGFPMTMGQRGYYFDPGSTSPSLYAVDIATNKARKIAIGPSRGTSADWLVDDGGNVEATMTVADHSGEWKITDNRGRVLASGTEPEGSASIVGYNSDRTGLIYRIRAKDGERTYFQVPLTGGGQPKAIFEGNEIESFYYDPASERVIGYRPDDPETDDSPVFFDQAAQETVGKVITAFDRLGGSFRDSTPDNRKILIETAGNNDSGTWYLVDTREGQSHVIGMARPQIGFDQVGPVSSVKYKAADGLEIEAILTLPPGREAKNLPLVMLPHGGPRANDYLTFDWWAQAFASRGYAVLQPNFRGSTGYGLDFMHKGDGEWGRKMQTDLTDGITHLAAQGTIDPKRVCIVGGSYGGYAALAGVTLQKDVYRCAVSVAGVSDLDLFFNREYRESGQSRDVKEVWLEMMGPRDTLGEVSPRSHAAQANAPILLIHGRDDTVVPYEQSTKMADALKDAGKPYQFVEMKGEDHWLSRSETRKQMLEAAVNFVEKYDPPD